MFKSQLKSLLSLPYPILLEGQFNSTPISIFLIFENR